MESADRQQVLALLGDPATPAETLAQIAAEHPESWPLVAQHPNVYPGLLEWMRQQGFVPPVPDPTTAAAPPSAAAVAEPGRRHAGASATVLALLAALVLVAVIFVPPAPAPPADPRFPPPNVPASSAGSATPTPQKSLMLFEFENIDGYRFSMDVFEYDPGVKVDVANAKPGEAEVTAKVTVSASAMNLLSNKNFISGIDASPYPKMGPESVISIFPLYTQGGLVCEYANRMKRTSWNDANRGFVEALGAAGYCTETQASVTIALPSLAGGEAAKFSRSIPRATSFGAVIVSEEMGEKYGRELGSPKGFVVTYAVRQESSRKNCWGKVGGWSQGMAYSTVALNC